MGFQEDPRLLEVKSIPMAEMVDRLGISGLKTNGNELTGPCPICGGRDRFSINLRNNAFLCRKCPDMRGGDQVALVMGVMGTDFKGALQWVCGDKPVEVSPQELERRKRRREEEDRKQREASERYRKKSISDARSIWQRSRPGHMGIVRSYLSARGLVEEFLPHLPADLHFIVKHPYVKKIDGRLETAHIGPCVISAIREPSGQLTAVHQTWVDIDPPHGKATIKWGDESLPAKMVRGSKKGGAIRLFSPKDFDTLVMGEGIETTLTAAAAWKNELDPMTTAYWAGVDLGNMAGKMKDARRKTGLPDLSDDEAFVPPPWTKRLFYIMDGDSDPKTTRAKLECGLRRAMAKIPNLECKVVPAAKGKDLNDMLTKDDGDDR